VAVTVVAVVAVVVTGVNSYDFQKYITDDNELASLLASGSDSDVGTGLGIASLCFCVRGTDFQFAERCRQCFGVGGYES
jgi:hypothetical protein